LRVRPICADFTGDLDVPRVPGEKRRIVYFPGSTIGNFAPDEASALLRRIVGLDSDGLLIGIDLQKDVGVLERAYNDAAGLTADFNLNLLARINRELEADFDVRRFEHRAFFNAAHGRIEMHVVSRTGQSVHIAGRTFRFVPGESIRTELSYKYTPGSFAALARSIGLSVRRVWTDADRYFSVQCLG
jgi:dimethylhistidine N-methyltransferase